MGTKLPFRKIGNCHRNTSRLQSDDCLSKTLNYYGVVHRDCPALRPAHQGNPSLSAGASVKVKFRNSLEWSSVWDRYCPCKQAWTHDFRWAYQRDPLGIMNTSPGWFSAQPRAGDYLSLQPISCLELYLVATVYGLILPRMTTELAKIISLGIFSDRVSSRNPSKTSSTYQLKDAINLWRVAHCRPRTGTTNDINRSWSYPIFMSVVSMQLTKI